MTGAPIALVLAFLPSQWVTPLGQYSVAIVQGNVDQAIKWDADQRRVLIAAADVAPTYCDDAVQAAVGWPLVEMALQGGQTPVILTGILRPSPEGDRAWCRVLEFAEEFGISVSYEPLLLGERRGG